MNDAIAIQLANVLKKNAQSDHREAFERAFELTKAYAGSGNAQAAAIPVVFEKLFTLFVAGTNQD
ncbi:MAG: hypothetical protein CSA34_04520 [Desulfobulbus propionicus]|nr:MAG: hypothetical protein CSA34_04520 [Desulfobulbus propionicus]